MSKSKTGLLSKASAEASAGYSNRKAATADGASGNDSPTVGKSIPIIAGGARPEGAIIWCNTRFGKNNACIGDIAVCFGRNAFGRPLSLSGVAINSVDVYLRKDGVTLDPPGAVRFYDGTQTTADPLIASIEGVANTPAWTGYVYAVLENVLLVDGTPKLNAEFTDNGTEATSTARVCDAALAGLDLKYNQYTGLYYAIDNPGTDHSHIITSDGCRILNKVKVRLPQSYTIPVGRAVWPVCCELNIIRCSNLVTITGYWMTDYAVGVVYTKDVPREWVVRPDTGIIDGGSPWYTAPSSSLFQMYTDTVPSNSGLTIKASFALPNTGAGSFAVLRFLNRSSIAYLDPAFMTIVTNGLTLGPNSNLSGMVFRMSEPLGDRTTGLGRLLGASYADRSAHRSECDDVSLVSRPVTQSPGSLFWYGPGWWVDEAPLLQDVIYMTNDFAQTILGGIKKTGSTLHTYRLGYSQSGIRTISSADIDMSVLTGWTVGELNYDPKTESLLLALKPPSGSSVNSRIYKISPFGFVSYIETGGPTFDLVPEGSGFSADGFAAIQNTDGSVIQKIDLTTGDLTTLYTGAAPVSQPVIDLANNLVSLPTVSGRTSYAVSQVTANDIALSDLITDICALKGYSPTDLVFEGFSGLVARGMTISSTTQISDLLNRMGQLYGFIFAETDGKLKFRRRRQSSGTVTPDVTLTDADLVEGPENITVQRQAATTILGSLALTWLDPDRNYESNNVLARRIAGVLSGQAGTRDEEISLPLAIDQATARKFLFESFFAQAEAETRVSFSVGPSNLRIEAGDLIQITADGATRNVLARRVTHRADMNTLDIEADLFMAQATPAVGSAGGNTSPAVNNVVRGWYIPLEIPYIRTTDYVDASKSIRYHGVAALGAAEWAWADVYRSRDGLNFSKLFEYGTAPMTVARVHNVPNNSPLPFAADNVNTLTIEVVAGSVADFETVSYAQQMSGANLCAYGAPGRWELLTFQIITDNLDGTYTLSNLQRGLYGTHTIYSADSTQRHELEDMLVYLDPAKITETQYAVGDFGLSEWFAIKTDGVNISETIAGPSQFNDVAMLQFQPANVKATHVPGSNNLVITWDEVTCIPGIWADSGASTPMHAPTTYTVLIDKIGTDFTVSGIVGNTYTWTGYGADLGATSPAQDNITKIVITPTVTGIGNGIPGVGKAYDI